MNFLTTQKTRRIKRTQSGRRFFIVTLLLGILFFQHNSLNGALKENAKKEPYIGYVFPAGAKTGEKITILISGQNLLKVTGLLFNTEEISSTFKSQTRILDTREIRLASNRMISLQATMSNADSSQIKKMEQQLAQIEKRITMAEPLPDDAEMVKYLQHLKSKRQPNEQLLDLVRYEINVPSNLKTGTYFLRLQTEIGISNPLKFFISAQDEIIEKEPNDLFEKAQKIEITPSVINGQILPGERDLFQFIAEKDMVITFVVKARELIPYMADAVPGWFQPILSVKTSEDNTLAWNDDFLKNPDPILTFRAPDAGTYFLEIKDAIDRGREDFVYRISYGKPVITSVFPSGGKRGETVTFLATLSDGEKHSVKVKLPSDKNILSYPLTVSKNKLDSDPFYLSLTDYPTFVVKESCSNFSDALLVRTGQTIYSRLSKKDQRDLFKIEFEVGETIVFEVRARRDGSPIDSALYLYDTSKKMILMNDDFKVQKEGLVTHHADSLLTYTSITGGTYFISAIDKQNRGDDFCTYSLTIKKPKPTYDLMIAPSAINIKRNEQMTFDAHIERRDGFKGAVAIYVQDENFPFLLSNNIIDPGKDRQTVTLIPKKEATARVYKPIFFGKNVESSADSLIGPIQASSVDEQMQAFLWTHLVPADATYVMYYGPEKKREPTATNPKVKKKGN